MQLKIRRLQKSGMMGGIKFEVTLQAAFTPDEQALIDRYKLKFFKIFEHEPDDVIRNRVYLICPDNLTKQVSYTCESPDEAQWFEYNVVKACQEFQKFLGRIETFDGREVVVDLAKKWEFADRTTEYRLVEA